MTQNYMLTLACGPNGHRDVLVREADGIHHAIQLAEKECHGIVSHGHGTQSLGSAAFRPSVIIDASTGDVEHLHDDAASASLKLSAPLKVTAPKGEGRRPTPFDSEAT